MDNKECIHQMPSVKCEFDGSNCNGSCGCYSEKKITNAEKIRNMTDEELAQMILDWQIEPCNSCLYKGMSGRKFDCKQGVIEFLQSEAK